MPCSQASRAQAANTPPPCTHPLAPTATRAMQYTTPAHTPRACPQAHLQHVPAMCLKSSAAASHVSPQLVVSEHTTAWLVASARRRVCVQVCRMRAHVGMRSRHVSPDLPAPTTTLAAPRPTPPPKRPLHPPLPLRLHDSRAMQPHTSTHPYLAAPPRTPPPTIRDNSNGKPSPRLPPTHPGGTCSGTCRRGLAATLWS